MKKVSIVGISFDNLSNEDKIFLSNVYNTNNNYYLERLKNIGFVNKEKVLDAGCGFGQWSIALSSLNKNVNGIDFCKNRIQTMDDIVINNNITNITAKVASLENIPYPDETFDAIYSYSVIYHTEHKKSITEMNRVLTKGGLIYLNFNGLGWFIYILINRGILKLDFVNIKKGLKALYNTLFNKSSIHAINKKELFEILKSNGLEVIHFGGDGEVNMNKKIIRSSYKKKYYGFDGVIEVLARKKKI